MLRILKKIKFNKNEDRMSDVGAIEEIIENYEKGKNENLKFLLSKRYSWMNEFIKDTDIGLEVGTGAGLSKKFILNKNLKISDLSEHQHLDFKNVDAQKTSFDKGLEKTIQWYNENHKVLENLSDNTLSSTPWKNTS